MSQWPFSSLREMCIGLSPGWIPHGIEILRTVASIALRTRGMLESLVVFIYGRTSAIKILVFSTEDAGIRHISFL